MFSNAGLLPANGTALAVAIIVVLLLHSLVVALYNLWFHELRAYPGPKLWAISRLPYVWHRLSGNLNRKILEFFERHGSVVRIAPDELAFAEAAAWKDIYGMLPDRKQNPKDLNVWPRKQEGWDKAMPVANDAMHSRLRRVFGPAFTTEAVRAQGAVFSRFIDLLVSQLEEAAKQDQAIDICKWFNFMAFDVIGELGFGVSFHCLESGAYHEWVEAIMGGLSLGVLASQLNRYGIMMVAEAMLPRRVFAKMHVINDYVAMVVKSRITKGFIADSPDIFNHVLKAQGQMNLSEAEMRVNGFFITLGGSETTASLLSGALWFLCHNRQVLERARKEVFEGFEDSLSITADSTIGLTYLHAVLQEALRIFPPTPDGAPRIIASQNGQMVAGHWVPYGTSCAVAPWAANHYSGNFLRAGEFLPERWLGQDASFANDLFDVAQPFSMGPRNCIGSNFARAEMRLCLAKMLWHFDMYFAGKDDENWHSSLRAVGVWNRTPLYIKLVPRPRD